ncbi:hypothetical protein F3Y22_tig00110893pilonHSYRG00131 [Hibiscus syriacus]|uniref:Ion transport domain-containing protein n=1 Tax=Hibiscus syriacus TaxID=106335 RepID=A0A6A2ZFH6_HIBSY|nr:hypothetical protein F3Y22_tig00110893pilonHSYRG00131 [Hibiscus syriacus]
MEMKASTESLKSISSVSRLRVEGVQRRKKENESIDEGSSLSLSNLSKIILPPLGASSYNHNSQTSSTGWIISPMDTRYRCWETFMVVLVFYSAWVYPSEIAFFASALPTALYVCDNVVDSFFAVDIVLAFFAAYIDSTTHLLVCDHKKIAKRYLSTWFNMDLASTIPFDSIGHLFNAKSILGIPYSCLSLLRFWRLRRVNEFFTRLEKDIRVIYFWIRSARLVTVSES